MPAAKRKRPSEADAAQSSAASSATTVARSNASTSFSSSPAPMSAVAARKAAAAAAAAAAAGASSAALEDVQEQALPLRGSANAPMSAIAARRAARAAQATSKSEPDGERTRVAPTSTSAAEGSSGAFHQEKPRTTSERGRDGRATSSSSTGKATVKKGRKQARTLPSSSSSTPRSIPDNSTRLEAHRAAEDGEMDIESTMSVSSSSVSSSPSAVDPEDFDFASFDVRTSNDGSDVRSNRYYDGSVEAKKAPGERLGKEHKDGVTMAQDSAGLDFVEQEHSFVRLGDEEEEEEEEEGGAVPTDLALGNDLIQQPLRTSSRKGAQGSMARGTGVGDPSGKRARFEHEHEPAVERGGDAGEATLADRGVESNFTVKTGGEEKNLVYLSEVAQDGRGKAAASDEEREGVVVGLKDGESIVFSGSVSLTVLHGSVSVLGALLSGPSKRSYPIYSPKHHPLAVIRPVALSTRHRTRQPTKMPHRLPFSLPANFSPPRTRFASVIWLRPLRSGIEGVARIIPSFKDSFDPPRWRGTQEEGKNEDWGITGFFPMLTLKPDLRSQKVPRDWSACLHDLCPPPWSASEEEQARARRSLEMDRDNEEEEEEDEEPIGRAETEADAEANPPVVLVRGPKRVGKSTFARLAVNRLLTRYQRVAFLECDLGQSEFTPAGIVSLTLLDQPLLGPPFTHPCVPLRAHFIGSTSPRSAPSTYLSALSDLFEHFRLHVQFAQSAPFAPPSGDETLDDQGQEPKIASVVPLVINTQGWVKGLGVDLLARIEAVMRPNLIVSFLPPDGLLGGDDFAIELAARASLPGGGEMMTNGIARVDNGSPIFSSSIGSRGSGPAQLHVCQLEPFLLSSSSTGGGERHNAADLRALSTMAYFYARLPPSGPSGEDDGGGHVHVTWDFELSLLARPPWTVEWSEGLRGGAWMVGEAQGVKYEHVLRALNGSVVGVVVLEGEEEDGRADGLGTVNARAIGEQSSSQFRDHPRPLQYVPTSMSGVGSHAGPPFGSSTCLGLAIVRSIDPLSSSFHLLTPLHPRSLASHLNDEDRDLDQRSSSARRLGAPPRSEPARRLALVKGDLELPIWAYLDAPIPSKDRGEAREGAGGSNGDGGETLCGVPWKEVPYLSWEGVGEKERGAGGASRRVRRNLMRRGQR